MREHVKYMLVIIIYVIYKQKGFIFRWSYFFSREMYFTHLTPIIVVIQIMVHILIF